MKIIPTCRVEFLIFLILLVFAGPVGWTENMTKTELNTTTKDQTSGCGCTDPENFWLPIPTFDENQKDLRKPVFLQYI